MRSAGVALQVTKVAGGVFQAEARLVPLCHFTAGPGLQQVVVAELVHAVVVPVGWGGKQRVSWEQTASHCINAAVSSRVTLTGRDGGFMACVFNPLTSSAKQFCKRRTLTWHIRKYQRTMGTN